jgi:hypothetical protein
VRQKAVRRWSAWRRSMSISGRRAPCHGLAHERYRQGRHDKKTAMRKERIRKDLHLCLPPSERLQSLQYQHVGVRGIARKRGRVARTTAPQFHRRLIGVRQVLGKMQEMQIGAIIEHSLRRPRYRLHPQVAYQIEQTGCELQSCGFSAVRRSTTGLATVSLWQTKSITDRPAIPQSLSFCK